MTQNPAVVTRFFKILEKQYFAYVKDAILWLEVQTGERSKRSIYELRDALDHIAIALHPSTSEEEAIKCLDAVEEHFRRAAVEPAEWLALEYLTKLLKIKERGFWWWKLFLLKPPNSEEFNDKIYKGQELVAKGRHFKAVSLPDSYNNLKEAYIIFRKLLDGIQPTEIYSRIFAVALSVVFFILGIIVTIILPTLIQK